MIACNTCAIMQACNKLEKECDRLQTLYDSSAQVEEAMETQLKQCRGRVIVL